MSRNQVRLTPQHSLIGEILARGTASSQRNPYTLSAIDITMLTPNKVLVLLIWSVFNFGCLSCTVQLQEQALPERSTTNLAGASLDFKFKPKHGSVLFDRESNLLTWIDSDTETSAALLIAKNDPPELFVDPKVGKAIESELRIESVDTADGQMVFELSKGTFDHLAHFVDLESLGRLLNKKSVLLNLFTKDRGGPLEFKVAIDIPGYNLDHNISDGITLTHGAVRDLANRSNPKHPLSNQRAIAHIVDTLRNQNFAIYALGGREKVNAIQRFAGTKQLTGNNVPTYNIFTDVTGIRQLPIKRKTQYRAKSTSKDGDAIGINALGGLSEYQRPNEPPSDPNF